MAPESARNLKTLCLDIAEGFVSVNPLYLKPFDKEDVRKLFKAIQQAQGAIRSEPFPFNDAKLVNKRNMKLQRLHVAAVIIRNFCREKKILLA